MVTGARREGVLAVLVFGLVAALFLWRPLLAGSRGVFVPNDLVNNMDRAYPATVGTPAQNELLSDVTLYYYPYARYAAGRLAQGQFPLWNPLLVGGTPFHATAQAALLDPVNLLTRPFGDAVWVLGAWLRLTLAGLGVYGLLRALGRRPVAGVAGGIVFAYCAFLTVWLNYSVTTAAIWLPFALWATVGLVQSGRASRLAALAAVLGVQFYGGHPETSFVIGLTWAAFALTRLTRYGQQAGIRPTLGRAGQLTVAAVLGVALGLGQLAPLLDLIARSELLRSREIALTAAGAAGIHNWATSLQLLIVTVVPNFSGTPTEYNYWYPLGQVNFNEQASYCGLSALGLAGVGLRYRVPGRGFFAVAGLGALVLMLHLPALDVLYALPGFRQGYGARWALLFSLCVAVLAGLGLEGLSARAVGYGRTAWAWALGFGLPLGGVLALYAMLRSGTVPSWLTHHRARLLIGVLDPLHGTVYWPFLFVAGGVLVVATLALARPQRRLPQQIAVLVLLTLLIGDGLTFGSSYNPVIPVARNLPPPPIAGWLQARLGHSRFTAAADILVPNLALLYGLRDLRGYEDLVPQEYARVFNSLLSPSGAESFKGPLSSGDSNRLDVAAVRYILTPRRLDSSATGGLVHRARVGSINVYENTHALARAYGVYAARTCNSAKAAARALDEATFDPHRTVLLEGVVAPDQVVTGPPPPVRFVSDKAEQVILDAEFAHPGYLVLADSWAGGWQADVNGQPTPILRANGVFRAVHVAAGRHRIRFSYRPPLVYTGSAVSGGALVVILGLFVWDGLHRRRRRIPARSTEAQLEPRSFTLPARYQDTELP